MNDLATPGSQGESADETPPADPSRSAFAQARRIFDSLVDEMAVLDVEGRILVVNQAWRDFGAANGGSPELINGAGLHYIDSWRIARDDPAAPDLTAIRDALASVLAGEARTLDLDYACHGPGDQRWFQLTITRIDDSLAGALVSHRNITARKNAENALDRLQAQMQRAARMESIGRLAGGVAHDFNNMLGVIIGRTEVALAKIAASDPIRADLEEIQVAAQRSATLTRQLLAYARRQTVAPLVIDLNDVITRTLRLLRRLLDESIELAWIPGDDLWPVRIDPAQLGQLLSDLCVNARDAIGESGRIEIETSPVSIDDAFCADVPEAIPGDYVKLTVRDNGAGMPSEVLDNAFDPFFTTKDTGEGAGLGLSTVYGAVRQNDGFVVLTSEPGVGTAFHIHLPRHSGAGPETRTPAPEAAARQVANLIVVEDEPAMLSLLIRVLTGAGFVVHPADNADAALDLAREHGAAIDLVLTDVVMPGMNGRELAEAIADLGLRCQVLYMSGHPNDVLSKNGILDDNVNFIQKPFTIDDITNKVVGLLDDRD